MNVFFVFMNVKMTKITSNDPSRGLAWTVWGSYSGKARLNKDFYEFK